MQSVSRHCAHAVTAVVLLALVHLMGGCAAGDLLSGSQPSAETQFSAAAVSSGGFDKIAAVSNTQSGPLLVVITYGNGWSATSSGSGLRATAEAIRRQFPHEQVITRGCDDQDGIRDIIVNHRGPVALVGHSFGGCRSIEIAGGVRRLIDWVVLLDPVPTNDWAFPHPGKYFKLPPNVLHATCFYRGAGMFPMSYPIANPSPSLENRLRPMGHSDFCKNAEVRNCILDVCARAQAGEFAGGGSPALAVAR